MGVLTSISAGMPGKGPSESSEKPGSAGTPPEKAWSACEFSVSFWILEDMNVSYYRRRCWLLALGGAGASVGNGRLRSRGCRDLCLAGGIGLRLGAGASILNAKVDISQSTNSVL